MLLAMIFFATDPAIAFSALVSAEREKREDDRDPRSDAHDANAPWPRFPYAGASPAWVKS